VPSTSGRSWNTLFWFFSGAGKTSRLNSVSGTQNEWITSLDLTRKRTFSFTGTTSTGISPVEPTV
jgi:hypothetical protein